MSQQTDLAVLVNWRPLPLGLGSQASRIREPWVGIVVPGEQYGAMGCLLTVVVPQSWRPDLYQHQFRVTTDCEWNRGSGRDESLDIFLGLLRLISF